GARDLPVLVVAGEGRRGDHAAVADLIADMADGRIGVAQPRSLVPGASDVPQWTAAIFNRGTPGFAVDYGGAMHVSLLRACTGWPSGVWIDPPRRSAPDGSAFELEHWSHVFEHALFFAPGDWRRAGCAKEAQAYNRPLRATRETSHGGKLPAKAWLFRLAKLGGPGEVVLGALKPSGNPLAAGDPSPPARPDGHVDISLRFYEAAGAPVEVEVASLAPVAQAWRANLLEARQEEAAVAAVPAGGGLRGGSCRLPVRPGELCTMCLRLPVLTPGQDEGASTHDVEVAQPTFSRYWLHNRGAAPMGNQALAVHFQSASAVARAGSSVTVVAHVASGAAHATQAGRLELVAPQDWQVDPPGRLFSLAPGAYLSVKVRVDVPDKCRPGRHFAAVRVADGAGQVQEDILTVDVLPPLGKAAVAGGPSSADAGGPGVVRSRDASALPAPFGHPSGQRASELEAVLEAEERQVGAGKSDQLRLHLSNRTAGELRGEVQLLSPVETWPYVGPSAQGFRLGPGQSCTVTARVIGPVSGWLCSWALFKVMYFGRLWYSPAVRLVLGNKPPVAAPGHKGSA
ncbi:MAG TPA: NEW3 domain-containing protein, partial [Acidimicrobiales bacterium]|nr:NEW3 domain-containing protein [Acidimicrobiales bacterium]